MHNITKEQAISAAKKYNLEHEVNYEIEINGCTPEEALKEWDIMVERYHLDKVVFY